MVIQNLEVDPKEYPSYEERELIKNQFRNEYDKASTHQKAWLLLHKLIWAHYWRAREHLEASKKHNSYISKIAGYKTVPGMELEIDWYTNHWLWANGDRLVEPEVMKILKEEFHYEPKESKYLYKGMSEYQFNQEKK